VEERCQYPGCREDATIRCGMYGCLHHVCAVHGNGGEEICPEEFVAICWRCDGKGWGDVLPPIMFGIYQFESEWWYK